ncbi:MAG: patatin-like phospholipase family protein [Pseudomonadota bacterium]
MARQKKVSRRVKRKISLALQGGGAHGAFTWGVLDRLLEDGRFEISGVSGTSAGAMNAVAMADGFAQGGNEGARDKLEQFWLAVADRARLSPLKRAPIDVWLGNWSLDRSPGVVLMDVLSRLVSPYDFNPLGINPLRNIVEELIDFERINALEVPKIFVAATNVQDGHVRVFKNRELSVDTVMASASLPYLFKAVELEDQSYWDGGYVANPVLFPYVYECDADDVILIQINPVERPETPKTARDIANRVDEITFNSSLLRELRALSFVTKALETGSKLPKGFRPLHIHRIEAGSDLVAVTASSKLNIESGFVRHLQEIGRNAADQWLAKNGKMIGKRSSFDPLGGMPLFPDSNRPDMGLGNMVGRLKRLAS